MAMSLANQVVLVTGCSSGIGRALALELAQRGQRVFASARKPQSLHGLDHPAIEKLALDVTDAGSIVVVRALLADKAPRIVRAGKGARVYYALGQLPGATRDRVVTRRFGLLGWKG
jgi:NAD(P)-dependent dehydrogenase (short-subunit alcohol dehydrogenase family)